MARPDRKVKNPQTRHRYPGEFENITGQRYGRLVAVRFIRRVDDYGRSLWLFQCDCGALKEARADMVRSGQTHSCGCLRSYRLANRTIEERRDLERQIEEHW